MAAPLQFYSVQHDGTVYVQVGKSDQLREVQMTRAERLRLIAGLAESLYREETR